MSNLSGERRGRSLLNLLLLSSVLAMPAFAQDPPPAADEGASGDEEIVVTAQRRKEAVNTVGMPIQAFSGSQLKELRVTSTQDLSAVDRRVQVANFQVCH